MEKRLSYAEKGKGKAHYSDDNKRRVRIKAPELDTSRKIKENELTLIGRVTNLEEQEISTMIPFLTQSWSLKGRAEGSDLGEGCFQVRFEREDDLKQVLENRPYTFAQWMVILEKWEPVISPTFPSKIPFWIRLKGLPLHYWQDEMVKQIGEEAGRVDGVEITTTYARARVTVDGLQPILSEAIIEFPNGEVTVKLEYERLEKFCSFCNRLTHEEKDCIDHKRREREERETNRLRESSHYRDEEPRSNIRQRGEIQSYHQKERAYAFNSRRDYQRRRGAKDHHTSTQVNYPQREMWKQNWNSTVPLINQSFMETEPEFTPWNVEILNLSKWLPLEKDLNQPKIPKVMDDLREVSVESVARARTVPQGEERNLIAASLRNQNDQTLTIEAQKNSPLSLPSPPSSSSPKSSLSGNWDHNVFPSFHGPDVRERFLSHMFKEFKNKGIQPFIDNNIERSKSIGPELERAIRGSKIAIVLLSKNYASSSWCLDELVEIMTCRGLGQKIMTIFYEVDPTDVKKQTGYFGKVFDETCQSKAEEKIGTWRKALEGAATIAGYDSKNWKCEATMIEDITTYISKTLNHLTPSCDFERYIGMGSHVENMKPLLSMDSSEVRMIGIWGPPGIGKNTIARFLFNKLSKSFQLSVFMENIKVNYPRPCPDEYSAQLQLQEKMLSQMLDHKDMAITHLRTAPERLKEKKVLLVLDDVDRVAQLEALAEDIRWFGRGSRIIIITEDVRVLRAHGIKDIYTVDLPSDDEALQIFCMYAFDQKYPKDGFRKLAWEIVCHAGKLPLGLKVMGSYFRNMSKQDWKKALPQLWRNLDGEIESIFKFSYDALDYDDKYLFLHIACLFVNEETERVKEYLAKTFPNVSHRLDVLAEKSLIYMDEVQVIRMHDLLEKFGKQIVRKQSMDPRQREFLVNSGEISEILDDDGAGSEKVIGIKFDSNGSELNISERAFEGMSNLQFLKMEGYSLHLPHGLSYLSSKLRLLYWKYSPMTRFPSNVNMKFLVELYMPNSKLEKLWGGIKRLPNLKWVDLSYSKSLKKLPDLSTAINLKKLDLSGCSSLVELEILPVNVNLKSLERLYLRDCSSLKRFPEISTNIRYLNLSETAIEEVPSSIRSWSRLESLDMSGCKKLKKFAPALDSTTECDTKRQKVSPLVQGFPRLRQLILNGCKQLLSLSQLPDSLEQLDAGNCESLERLDCSFRSSYIRFNFRNCFRLNNNGRDLIIRKSSREVSVLPGKEIPTYFTYRANRGSLTVKLHKRSFPSSLKFKACILLVSKKNDDVEAGYRPIVYVDCEIWDKRKNLKVWCIGSICEIDSLLTEHLYIYEVEANVTSNELLFKFTLSTHDWMIKECGVVEENEGGRYDSIIFTGSNGGRSFSDHR